MQRLNVAPDVATYLTDGKFITRKILPGGRRDDAVPMRIPLDNDDLMVIAAVKVPLPTSGRALLPSPKHLFPFFVHLPHFLSAAPLDSASTGTRPGGPRPRQAVDGCHVIRFGRITPYGLVA